MEIEVGKFFHSTFLAALVVSSNAVAAEWPPLPTTGFISERAAETIDVQNGDAVFAAAVGEKVIGRPIAIAIPQYATVRDSGEQVVVVQAEEANGLRMYGVRNLSGVETVIAEAELNLLGTNKPQ